MVSDTELGINDKPEGLGPDDKPHLYTNLLQT